MGKHKHKWQYAGKNKLIPTGLEIANFICECGTVKTVKVKEIKNDN